MARQSALQDKIISSNKQTSKNSERQTDKISNTGDLSQPKETGHDTNG